MSPNDKSGSTRMSSPPGIAGEPLRADASVARPRGLPHVLISTSDVVRAVSYYKDVLGLGLSDAAGDIFAFMHGVNGSDHHLVTFAKSDACGFNHCSWDVGSVNNVGLGAMQTADAGFVAGWGSGGTCWARIIFITCYPWGRYSEYSHRIDYVPVDGLWKASHVSPDNGFYLWGQQPPSDFAFNYESTASEATRVLVATEPAWWWSFRDNMLSSSSA